MSYRTLSTLHLKAQLKDQTRADCEGVIIQFMLADMEWEEVFIDEFNISSHRNKFSGWVQKDHKPTIASTLNNFSMYFAIAVSSKHIYGVLASEKANTSQTFFIYFLDCLIKYRESLFKQTNEKTLFVINNASIHKTKSIDEYVQKKRNITPDNTAILTCFKWSRNCNPSNKI